MHAVRVGRLHGGAYNLMSAVTSAIAFVWSSALLTAVVWQIGRDVVRILAAASRYNENMFPFTGGGHFPI
jgi:hypothetical protein